MRATQATARLRVGGGVDGNKYTPELLGMPGTAN